MDKVVADAGAACADIATAPRSSPRVRAVRDSGETASPPARARVQEPLGGEQQLRGRRLGPRHPARRPPDPPHDLELRRREQGVRAPVPLRRARARAGAAGHARRAAAAGGAGIPAFYTPAGVGSQVAEGGLRWSTARRDGQGRQRAQGEALVRRQGLRPRARHHRRLGIVKAWRATATATSSSTPPPATSTRSAPSPPSTRSPRSRSCRAGAIDPDHVHLPGIS